MVPGHFLFKMVAKMVKMTVKMVTRRPKSGSKTLLLLTLAGHPKTHAEKTQEQEHKMVKIGTKIVRIMVKIWPGFFPRKMS